MRLWHIAALLVAGIVVGVLFPGRFTALFPAATLYVFLPALIFEAAWYLDFRIMRRTWKPIALLAVPGVIVTAVIVAGATHYLTALPWGAAVLLGAILSATDPVAVVAIFRRVSVPKPLATIIESESLLNDAIAVVLYRATIAVIILAGGPGIRGAIAEAIIGVAAGIVLGIAFAYAAAFVLRDRISPFVQSAATFAGAYGVYALADHYRWSGIFAVLTFGIALRELERNRITVSSAEEVAKFWEWAATAANLVLFVLIGAALDFTRLLDRLPIIAVTIAAVAFARVVLAYGILHFARETVGRAWRTVVRMAGIRGALALALALATPGAIAQRSSIIDAVFAVVVLTILSGALTLTKRLSRLRLEPR